MDNSAKWIALAVMVMMVSATATGMVRSYHATQLAIATQKAQLIAAQIECEASINGDTHE